MPLAPAGSPHLNIYKYQTCSSKVWKNRGFWNARKQLAGVAQTDSYSWNCSFFSRPSGQTCLVVAVKCWAKVVCTTYNHIPGIPYGMRSSTTHSHDRQNEGTRMADKKSCQLKIERKIIMKKKRASCFSRQIICHFKFHTQTIIITRWK